MFIYIFLNVSKSIATKKKKLAKNLELRCNSKSIIQEKYPKLLYFYNTVLSFQLGETWANMGTWAKYFRKWLYIKLQFRIVGIM